MADLSRIRGPASPPWRIWRNRIGWLLLIWAASVAALGIAALVLKIAMRWVGLAG